MDMLGSATQALELRTDWEGARGEETRGKGMESEDSLHSPSHWVPKGQSASTATF
jgi:hypothetical protein